ncbi:MAG: response regulator transcription factor [Metallibacterium scheffleri]|jgi:two-component system copper resistance phosphate regulon response regulator CusR|uniref:response regulator transcription factor n=1 Tax=Metallibacterium scheffleri TaxID=993689 RepID=UPI0026EDA3AE|nr:response regulator transcription factor [Metallibacterium scheffleri]MCK9366516.1 response regulator transcription factor [Metallibacterium scheffleri]
MRLLVVEDSPLLGPSLERGLRAEGHAVDLAGDGVTACEFLQRYPYDAMLLDLGLPQRDGGEVLKRLRAAGRDTRVLVLSARDQVEDRVGALNLGADDYLVKPFAWDELLARLNALLRRKSEGVPLLRHGALSLDPATRLARVDAQLLALSPREYALLELLLRGRGQVYSRAQLFEHLYDAASATSDKVIEVLLSTLRAKLAQAGLPELIQTRRGFGYALE